jgi:hypothetical protein
MLSKESSQSVVVLMELAHRATVAAVAAVAADKLHVLT